MTGRQGGYGADDEDEALPWLEPAELDDDEPESSFPYRSLVVAGLAIVGVVALLWFVAVRFGGSGSDQVVATGEVPLIQAPEGPYKERPLDPGGLDVDPDSMTHAVAEGADPGSQIALDAMPEEPMPVAQPPIRRAPVPAPVVATQKSGTVPATETTVKRQPTQVGKGPVPVETAGAAPAKAPAPKAAPPVVATETQTAKAGSAASDTVSVQLGAFGSTATADQVWSKLAGRVQALGGLRKSVQPVESGGKTLYRLRAVGIASASEAGAICSKVQSAGEQCAVIR